MGILDDILATKRNEVTLLRQPSVPDRIRRAALDAPPVRDLADALLLIVAAFPVDTLLADLHSLALELGLSVVVEAHDADEVERALTIGARIVGINNRNLQTFEENLTVAERLAALVPGDRVRV